MSEMVEIECSISGCKENPICLEIECSSCGCKENPICLDTSPGSSPVSISPVSNVIPSVSISSLLVYVCIQ